MTTSARPFHFLPRPPLRFLRFLRFRPFFWAFGPGFPLPPLSSPSARFPFVPLASGSGYSASCSSFQPSIGSASQGLSQRPDPFFRPDQILPVPRAWFPVRVSRFCLFSSPVCSLSLFPASLPQPFHRCFSFLPVLPFHPLIRPCVRSLRFHPGFPVLPLRSRPVRTPLLGLCFFLSLLQASASQWLPLCRAALCSPSSPQVPFLRPARLFQPSFPPVFRSGSPLLFPSRLSSVVRFPLSPSVSARLLSDPSLLQAPQLRYSVLLLFFSPLQVSPHSCYFLSPSRLLRFGPSP